MASLAKSNKYLRTAELRAEQAFQSTASSSAAEGIKVQVADLRQVVTEHARASAQTKRPSR
ncbi:MAG: hypothetical protein ACAH95_15225 [Fimbriimonas sp.]